MDFEKRRAPASASAEASFPAIIPEPQIVEFFSGAVQRPQHVGLPEAADEISKLFAGIIPLFDDADYEVTIELDEEFAPEEVPPAAIDEAYELQILSDEAIVIAKSAAGVRWGLKTLADVFEGIPTNGSIPCTRILDWPTFKTRGVFIENKWGPDLMELDDWKDLVDYLAERKMNNLGISLYGCWGVQYDGGVTEWLMTPIPGHPEIKREWKIRWYSPLEDTEKEIAYLPPMFEQDLFGEVVSYGQEKGVEVIPYVNSLGHNTLIPRMIPDFAAKNEAGEPEEFGYCLSNPDLVEFVKGWYQHIYETYLKPNGVHTFHIQMDEVGRDFCRCAECAKHSMEEMLQDWVITLAKHLVDCGVQNVVLYNDQFTRHLDTNALDDTFHQKLRDAGIYENIVVDWWAYNNATTYPDTHPANGGDLRSWVKPMTCYYNWSHWDAHQKNVAVMCELGHREGSEGAASYSVFDPAWTLAFDALAEYSWNFRGAGPLHRFEQKWAKVRCDGDVLEAIRWMDRTYETGLPNLISYYAYTYLRTGKPNPRRYPEEPLVELANMGDEPEFVAEAGRRAGELLAGRTDEMSLNLIAEAARTEALGYSFAVMRDVFEIAHNSASDAADGGVAALQVEEALDVVTDAMAVIETHKPHYLVPSYLRDMSVVREYLLQLLGDLNEIAEGSRKWSAIRWMVNVNIAQRGTQG